MLHCLNSAGAPGGLALPPAATAKLPSVLPTPYGQKQHRFSSIQDLLPANCMEPTPPSECEKPNQLRTLYQGIDQQHRWNDIRVGMCDKPCEALRLHSRGRLIRVNAEPV